jgi:hypothetical protein
MRVEQVTIHLRSLPPNSADAAEVRKILLSMLLVLARYKGEREREEYEILLREAA